MTLFFLVLFFLVPCVPAFSISYLNFSLISQLIISSCSHRWGDRTDGHVCTPVLWPSGHSSAWQTIQRHPQCCRQEPEAEGERPLEQSFQRGETCLLVLLMLLCLFYSVLFRESKYVYMSNTVKLKSFVALIILLLVLKVGKFTFSRYWHCFYLSGQSTDKIMGRGLKYCMNVAVFIFCGSWWQCTGLCLMRHTLRWRNQLVSGRLWWAASFSSLGSLAWLFSGKGTMVRNCLTVLVFNSNNNDLCLN